MFTETISRAVDKIDIDADSKRILNECIKNKRSTVRLDIKATNTYRHQMHLLKKSSRAIKTNGSTQKANKPQIHLSSFKSCRRKTKP